MQISYHFALTKIQKLQNLKNNNNKKTFFLYRPVLPEIDRYGQYFFRYEIRRLTIPVRYILAGTVRYWLPCLHFRYFIWIFILNIRLCDWTLLFLIWVHDEKQGDSRRQLVKLKEPADFIFTRVFHSKESNSSSGNDQNYILSIG